jgi:hypothetical protein
MTTTDTTPAPQAYTPEPNRSWPNRHPVWAFIIFLAALVVIFDAVDAPESDSTAAQQTASTGTSHAAAQPATAPKPASRPEETTAQQNARAKAENYLDSMAFSRSGLISQLEYEGFTTSDAEYAVANVDVNWRDQAVKKAKDYLDSMAFSRSGLIEQLEYEGFTTEQATYGVDQTGL